NESGESRNAKRDEIEKAVAGDSMRSRQCRDRFVRDEPADGHHSVETARVAWAGSESSNALTAVLTRSTGTGRGGARSSGAAEIPSPASSPAITVACGPEGPYHCGLPISKTATRGTPSASAICIGPLSLQTRRSQQAISAIRLRRGARLTIVPLGR